MRYRKSDMKSVEKLPQAPVGVWDMTCVWEGQSKNLESMHTFLFKNDEYQIFHNCFISQLPELADEVGVDVEDDGGVDTQKFRKIKVRVTVDEGYTKSGNTFMKCTAFERLSGPVAVKRAVNQTPMEAVNAPDVSEDEDIPF